MGLKAVIEHSLLQKPWPAEATPAESHLKGTPECKKAPSTQKKPTGQMPPCLRAKPSLAAHKHH